SSILRSGEGREGSGAGARGEGPAVDPHEPVEADRRPVREAEVLGPGAGVDVLDAAPPGALLTLLVQEHHLALPAQGGEREELVVEAAVDRVVGEVRHGTTRRCPAGPRPRRASGGTPAPPAASRCPPAAPPPP